MTTAPFEPVIETARPPVTATPPLARNWPQPAASGIRPATQVPTGLADLDRLSPPRPDRLTLITGPPGVGITSLLLGITLAAAGQRRPVVYVNDHLGPAEITGRLLAHLSSVDLSHIPTQLTERSDPRLAAAASHLAQLPIVLIDARVRCTPIDLVRRIDQLASAAEPPALLILDRAAALTQVVDPTRPQLDGDPACLRQLLQALVDTPCPVLAVERPSGQDYPEPELITPTSTVSSLRAAVPELTEALWWLHRPDIYARSTDELGTGQLHVLWQRSGPTGYVKLAYQHHLARWTSIATPPPRQ